MLWAQPIPRGTWCCSTIVQWAHFFKLLFSNDQTKTVLIFRFTDFFTLKFIKRISIGSELIEVFMMFW